MSVAAAAGEFVVAYGGAPPRHIDLTTAQLDRLARSWLDVQQTRKALAQRELPESVVKSFAKAEAQLSRELTKALRKHALWPWLSQFPGLGGAHTALIIGRIGDPRRYPGQRCLEGHYLPPLYTVGASCPIVAREGDSDSFDGDGTEVAGAGGIMPGSEEVVGCPGTMLPPRLGSGVRSLWHWAGLHVEADGCAPRKRKGIRVTYEPRVRASVMQPGGIAEQIVRLSVPHYVDVYRATKDRLTLRVDLSRESDAELGPQSFGAVDSRAENEPLVGRSLRPFEADRIARKVAAKAFLGDLLVEWKRLVASEFGAEIDPFVGGDQ